MLLGTEPNYPLIQQVTEIEDLTKSKHFFTDILQKVSTFIWANKKIGGYVQFNTNHFPKLL